ncbi:hypothetical protein WJX79_007268 [Trebouxia sp. C0005]
MTGFDQRIFEFFGQPDHNYTVISSPSVTLNMQLVSAGPRHLRHQGGEGTFVGALGVMMIQCVLEVRLDTAGNMTVAANQIPAINIEAPAQLCGGRVRYEPYEQDVGQVVHIRHPPFELSLIAVKEFEDTVSKYNRPHFDIEARITEPLTPQDGLFGVLGDTVHEEILSPEEATYEVPTLFTVPDVKAPLMQTRRLLLSALPSFSPPVTASMR